MIFGGQKQHFDQANMQTASKILAARSNHRVASRGLSYAAHGLDAVLYEGEHFTQRRIMLAPGGALPVGLHPTADRVFIVLDGIAVAISAAADGKEERARFVTGGSFTHEAGKTMFISGEGTAVPVMLLVTEPPNYEAGFVVKGEAIAGDVEAVRNLIGEGVPTEAASTSQSAGSAQVRVGSDKTREQIRSRALEEGIATGRIHPNARPTAAVAAMQATPVVIDPNNLKPMDSLLLAQDAVD